MCLIVYSNDHAPLTVRLIYSSSKLRTVQMMIFSLVAMIGLAKCCITSACLQWLCHSGERIVARGPLVPFTMLRVRMFYIMLLIYFVYIDIVCFTVGTVSLKFSLYLHFVIFFPLAYKQIHTDTQSKKLFFCSTAAQMYAPV